MIERANRGGGASMNVSRPPCRQRKRWRKLQTKRKSERERREGKGKQIVARRNRFIARDIFQDFFELSQPATAESKLALCPRKIYFIRQ